jgi:hypothetical protein
MKACTRIVVVALWICTAIGLAQAQTNDSAPAPAAAIKTTLVRTSLIDIFIAIGIIDERKFQDQPNTLDAFNYLISPVLVSYLGNELGNTLSASNTLSIGALQRAEAELLSPSGQLWLSNFREANDKRRNVEEMIRSKGYLDPEIVVAIGKNPDVLALLNSSLDVMKKIAQGRNPVELITLAVSTCNNRITDALSSRSFPLSSFPDTTPQTEFMHLSGLSSTIGKQMAKGIAGTNQSTDPVMRNYMSNLIQFVELSIQSGLLEQRFSFALMRASPENFDSINRFLKTPYGTKVIQRLSTRNDEDILTPTGRRKYLAPLALNAEEFAQSDRFIERTWIGFERDLGKFVNASKPTMMNSWKLLGQYCGR